MIILETYRYMKKKDTRRKYLKNLSTQNQLLLFEAKVFVQTVR